MGAMNKREAWNLAHQVTQGFMSVYENIMDEAAISMGLQSGDCFLVIIPAHLFEPDPISVARLRIRVPYNSPIYYEGPLQVAKSAGFLDEVPEGGYILNRRGREALGKVMDAAYQQLGQLSLLSSAKIDELKLLLAKLVQASLLSPAHVCKWGILHSRRLDPGRNVAPVITIDQYLSDLASYRDDSHLAAWSVYSIDAHAWDILGVLWLGRASSTAEILNVLSKRCWSENETRHAITTLVREGWVNNGEKLTITEKGRQARERAEALTDEFFFSPWRVLTEAEYNRFCELMTQLNESLARYKST